MDSAVLSGRILFRVFYPARCAGLISSCPVGTKNALVAGAFGVTVSAAMKTLSAKAKISGFTLIQILTFTTVALAAPHNWVLKTGETVAGDYISSGTTTLVVKTGGTNCFVKISELSTNDWLYFQECKAAQRQRQLDDEAAQMHAAGWIELTSDLITLFPEKVRTIRDQIRADGTVDGTITEKRGWMDATFDDFNTLAPHPDYCLSFGVRDSQGKNFSYCLVVKRKDASLEAAPNPLVNEASSLKSGDKIRLYGHCDDYLGVNLEDMHDMKDSHCSFYIDRIEMIESAAEENAKEEITGGNKN